MTKSIDIQRLRNLTTGILHTEMKHIYEDISWIVGDSKFVTHMLPDLLDTVGKWLKENVTDSRFWNGKYDPAHVGSYELKEPTKDEREKMRPSTMEI